MLRMGRGGLGLRKKPTAMLVCLLIGGYMLMGGGGGDGKTATKDDFATAIERGGGIAAEKADLELENQRLRDEAARMAAEMKRVQDAVSAQGRSAQPQARAQAAAVVQMMAELDNKLQKNEADLQNKATQVDTDAIAAEKMINNGLVRLTSTSSLSARFLALT